MEERKVTKASIADILDSTQGHLILKWNAWTQAHRLQKMGITSLYCLTAIFFLFMFGFESYVQDMFWYSVILFAFCGLTLFAYIYLRITGNRLRTNLFLVMLLGALCVFLVYTGGVDNTGPLWIYVFPLFALFVQRLWAGVISVVILFMLIACLLWIPAAGVDPAQYTEAFKERYIAVYVAVSVMAFLYAFLRASAEMDLISINQYLKDTSEIDDLTLLPNRKRMQKYLYQEISRFRRGGKVFSIIFFDMDHFKQINDKQGHLCGDTVLKSVADIVRKVLRSQDICSRWGGEEFLVMLPDTTLQYALIIAERLRESIQNEVIIYGEKTLKVTASFGVREFGATDDLMDCIKVADVNLYRAKAEGRNRVIG